MSEQDGGPTTLEEHVGHWLEETAQLVRASTLDRYEATLRNHVLPILGRRPLHELRAGEIRDWRRALAKRVRPATANSALRVLRTCLRAAIADDELHIERDPTAAVRALPEHAVPASPLRAHELARILDLASHHYPQHHALLVTLAYTGARFGEASVLRWHDIDPEDRIVRIDRAHWHGVVGPTKTRSRRILPLVDPIARALRAHRKRLRGEEHPGAHLWCFPSRTGTLRQPSSLRKPWRRLLALAGVYRRVTIHSLRRTYVDLLRRAGVDAVVEHALVGHSSEDMREHYSHVGLAERRHAAEAVERLVARAAASRSGRRVTVKGEESWT